MFCFENKDKPQLLISANDTLTLSSKEKGFERLLVKVKINTNNAAVQHREEIDQSKTLRLLLTGNIKF